MIGPILPDGASSTSWQIMMEKYFFHKSIDASDKMYNTAYILGLMEEVIDAVGEQNIVQIIIDNEPQYKDTEELLMERQPHIYWILCAAHCINLILMDFWKLHKVQQAVDSIQIITKFIYNHTWILLLMQTYTRKEILRSDIT